MDKIINKVRLVLISIIFTIVLAYFIYKLTLYFDQMLYAFRVISYQLQQIYRLLKNVIFV